MGATVAVVAMGAMGSAVGAHLTKHGVRVLTMLAGRSEASRARAKAAGMHDASEADIAAADIILSIVPPRDAMAFAQRMAPALKASARKPLFIDCNAVSSEAVKEIGTVVAATGARFADGSIIGPPNKLATKATVLYVSGVDAKAIAPLSAGGLEVLMVDGPVGAASALKMSYAAITKGLTALATASVLSAERAGAGAGLRAELLRSQPNLLKLIDWSVPDMFVKAYRFVGEMEQVADQTGRESSAGIYRSIARLFQEIADDVEGPKRDVAVLESFFKSKS